MASQMVSAFDAVTWKRPSQVGVATSDIDLTELIVDFPVHARINIRSVTDIKREASEQHASQGGRQMRRGLFGILSRTPRRT
jgi:hypothetical protein